MVTFPPNSYLVKTIKQNSQRTAGLLFLGIALCGFIAFMALRDIQDGSQWIGGFALLFGAVFLWALVKTITHAKNPEQHRLIKNLATYGPINEIISRIEEEIKNPELQFPNCIVTKSWIIGGNALKTDIVFLPEIVWAHNKTLTHNYVKTHYVVVYRRNGHSFEMTAKEKECGVVLELISKKAPSAVIGYSPELKKLWASNKNTFVQEVEKRKKDVATIL